METGTQKIISDYALIGDCHSAALVAKDGAVDWACFPRFDSPSVFCHILDNRRGGSFLLAAKNPQKVEREYIEDTNVLVTRFITSTGVLEVTDCMPMKEDKPGRIQSFHAILRKATCVSGEVDVRVVVAPRFEYGAYFPRFKLTSDYTCEIVGGADALWVTASHQLQVLAERLKTTWHLRQGETAIIECAWSESRIEKSPEEHPSIDQMHTRLQDTIEFWQGYMQGCQYKGEFEPQVRRSALVLKALNYAPTGALVAAPTTSLPEEIGGVRNWDYRYTWIRDSALTLISMMVLGFKQEASAYRHFLRRTSAGRPLDLQIMYGITGLRSLPELELDHLSGHRDSKPVRIGNGAAKQVQLDIFGQLLDAVYLFAKVGGPITDTNWNFIRGVADSVADKWQVSDQGIWEIRDEPRHFIHSKVQCWLALERSIQVAELKGFEAPIERWREARENIREFLMTKGAAAGHFTQAVGYKETDAAVLLVPASGFLPVKHPVIQQTIKVVREQLETDGLLFRYTNDDGLAGHEGGFLLCSFWLLDCLIHGGEMKEADWLLKKLMGLANDVGLFAEEADTKTGELLGNFPQAFTHMALVTSCAHYTAALQGKIPGEGAYNFSEFALEQVLGK